VNLISIDELVETWARAHKEALAACAQDDDLSWWREALASLRPLPEDNKIIEDT
jgi:hypothetical protein